MKTKGEQITNDLIRLLARDLKLSPREIKTWSLSDVICMMADKISVNDNELYATYESQKSIQSNINTKRL